MSFILVQDAAFIAVLIAVSIPLGLYITDVMNGQKVFLTRILKPIETFIYRLMGIDGENEMTAKEYAISVLLFSLAGFIFLLLLLISQNILPFNPEHLASVNWQLAFNTTASFVSNTNWQAYSGESTMSYLSQSLGLTVQNFLSAATGLAVVFALIRGFTRKKQKTIGSFWHDLVRSILYILLPLSIVLAIVLVSQGVVQTLSSYHLITSLEGGIQSYLPLGPAASQIAIKQLGTNGGGFFGMNSAFPFENPTSFSNFLQMLSILLLPASLCVSFGKAVKDMKQGRTIYIVMLLMMIGALAAVTYSEQVGTLVIKGVTVIGNMEGKETIHGIGSSSLWAVATTAASNGSVNAALDSFTPLAGMVLMFLMQLGEIVFGGIGSGLYGMIAFVILTVFIAGLMVGRTPEYLSKKIEPFDMKMICIIVLTPLLLTLFGTAITVMLPQVTTWLTNTGAHGFSEILYAFSSMGNNNGSAFAGFMANTNFTNLVGGVIMLASRFIPMVAVIYLAGNLAGKKTVSAGEGTLSTSNSMFVGLLITVIIIVGALSFLPALSLGPIAEFFSAMK